MVHAALLQSPNGRPPLKSLSSPLRRQCARARDLFGGSDTSPLIAAPPISHSSIIQPPTPPPFPHLPSPKRQHIHRNGRRRFHHHHHVRPMRGRRKKVEIHLALAIYLPHNLLRLPQRILSARSMETFKSGFCFEPETGGGGSAAGALDIHIHHARNIHNICIYANQDVYAKLSLTCTPDDAVSTRIVEGGGKNPQFDERLQLKLANPAAAVLKCEIWMLSRARSFMEDQLLGFALVPLAAITEAGGGRLTQDFSLSSTDLFHSPAGTVRLTLSFDGKPYVESGISNSSSISSEFVILDPARIEFPEINVDRENQEMVSEYFSAGAAVPFVHLGGGSSESMEDCEMTVNSNESPDGSSIQNSGLFSASTTTSTVSCSGSKGPSPETPTSKSEKASAKKGEEDGGGGGNVNGEDGELGSVFKYPLGNINMEAEQSAMQQQIVDMYMRSMQQFTESLAKMKLPMDLDNPKPEDDGDVIQTQEGNKKSDSNKKDGSRVFYGSRAFF